MKWTFLTKISLSTLLLLSQSSVLWAESELDALIVYGNGFAFSVKETKGWKGDINTAQQYGANVIFYLQGHNPNTANTTLIRILAAKKTDEDTAKDIAQDMKEYQARYKGVKFKDISISHPEYKCFPKLFYLPAQFYEYVTYINPGSQKTLLLSASMNKQKTDANTDELRAYKQIIESLRVF
jgi:hypothetical protein